MKIVSKREKPNINSFKELNKRYFSFNNVLQIFLNFISYDYQETEFKDKKKEEIQKLKTEVQGKKTTFLDELKKNSEKIEKQLIKNKTTDQKVIKKVQKNIRNLKTVLCSDIKNREQKILNLKSSKTTDDDIELASKVFEIFIRIYIPNKNIWKTFGEDTYDNVLYLKAHETHPDKYTILISNLLYKDLNIENIEEKQQDQQEIKQQQDQQQDQQEIKQQQKKFIQKQIGKDQFYTILRRFLKLPSEINILHYKNICVFVFNTDGSLLIKDKKDLLVQQTYGLHEDVYPSIQLVIMNIMKNHIDIDEKGIMMYPLQSREYNKDYICCYCYTKNFDDCFENDWIPFEKIRSITFDNFDYEYILKKNFENLRNYKEFMEQTDIKQKNNEVEHKNRLILNGKFWIGYPRPLEYRNYNIKRVVMFLFNKNQELLLLGKDDDFSLPMTDKIRDGHLYDSLKRYIREQLEKNVNFNKSYLKMMLIAPINTVIFFVLMEGIEPFSDIYIDNKTLLIDYQFFPFSELVKLKCADPISREIFRMTGSDIKNYLDTEFPSKKKIEKK